MKHESEYGMMLRHSYYLRAAMNLAANRQQQLQKTLDGLGFAKIPTDHEDFTLVQVEAAKEIGGINTRMLFDAPREIEKYHFGPLQIALCLLYAIIEKYRELSKANQMFQDDAFDRYCLENKQFVQQLSALRDSVLHQRYDNMDEQENFVKWFDGDRNKHCGTVLIEGESIYQDYLRSLWRLLQ